MSTGAGDGRRSRWDHHNEQRRRRIIEAAIAVVEAGDPGAEVRVHQIAERAGLSRTVVYRHFADRADLDRAVQARILDDLWEELLPTVTLDGTVLEVIRRAVGTYVGWAVAHPALHRLADHDIGGDADGPLQQGLETVAGRVGELVTVGLEALGVDLSGPDAAGLDPLVFSIVGGVFSAVRRWVSRPEGAVPAATLVDMVSTSVWHVLDGQARRLGVSLDPDLRLDQLRPDRGAPAAGATR